MSSKEHVDTLKDIRNITYGKISNERRSGFRNCCKEYTFIKKAQIISFNNKMNALGMTHLVLDDEYNQTDILIHDITVPVNYGAPVIIGMVGYTRSGKSEGAQLIYFLNKQANKRYRDRNTELYLCWKEADLYLSLKKIKKGDTIWNDERPRTIGTGRLTQKWAINNVLHAIAKMENCFLFVTPDIDDIKVNICDLYLETAGQNRKTRINRFMILDNERRYFGHVLLKLHNDEKFRASYEKEKDEFIEEIKKNPKVKAAQDEDEESEIIQPNILPEIDNDKLFEILDSYESKATKRDKEIFLRHLKGEIFEDLNEIYGLTNSDYHYYKVLKFVKQNLDYEITENI